MAESPHRSLKRSTWTEMRTGVSRGTQGCHKKSRKELSRSSQTPVMDWCSRAERKSKGGRGVSSQNKDKCKWTKVCFERRNVEPEAIRHQSASQIFSEVLLLLLLLLLSVLYKFHTMSLFISTHTQLSIHFHSLAIQFYVTVFLNLSRPICVTSYPWMCVLLLESGQLVKSYTLRENTLSLSQEVAIVNSSMAKCVWGCVLNPSCFVGFGLACPCTGFLHAVSTTVDSRVQLSWLFKR